MTIQQLFGHDNSDVDEANFETVFGGLNEGAFPGVANECEVVVSAPPAMTVEVSTGTFATGGVYARVSAQHLLNIGAADAVNPRIDRVVCRRDNATDIVTVYVLAGVAAGVPVVPALTRFGGVWEISLAQVYVAAAVVQINTADITDERHDYSVCGFTTGRGKRGVEVLDRDLTQIEVVNTVVETSVYSHEIPAGALGATGGARLTLGGTYLNNSGVNRNLTLRIKLGATEVSATVITAIADGTDLRRWRLEVLLMNSAAAVQKWLASFQLTHSSAAVLAIDDLAGGTSKGGVGEMDSTEDTGAARTLDITFEHSAADPTLYIRKEIAVLEILPPA